MREGSRVVSYIDEIFPPGDLPNYQVKKVIGKGTYGHVAKALHKKSQQYVAIKKITGLFNSLQETRRILREILLLKGCRHPNIVHLLDVIIPKTQSYTNFSDLYLVTEFCDTDLSKIFRVETNFIEIEHVKSITYQLLCGLKYLHSANIIHRDLKPANVLINIKGKSTTVKICDFGLSRVINSGEKQEQNSEEDEDQQELNKRFLDQPKQPKQQPKPVVMEEPKKRKMPGRMGTTLVQLEKDKEKEKQESIMAVKSKKLDKIENKNIKLTLRVTTRWYRAPEIILLDKDYNKPIDIWAVGCIFGELLKMMKIVCADALQRFPLFPGKYCYPVSPNTLSVVYKNGYPQGKGDQLFMILSAIGKPTEFELSFLTDEKAKDYVRKIEVVVRKSFDDMFPKVGKDAIQVLKRSLRFNPKDRPTIEQLLDMPFFNSVRDKSKESVREVMEMSSEVQNEDLTMDQLRKYIIKEIDKFL